jgi:tetratricopeptide (TPR) repeat protein
MGGGVELRRVDALDDAPIRLPPLDPPNRDAYVWALQFSPDDRWLAALKPGEGRLWRLRTEEIMQLACEAAGRNFDVEEWERSLSDVEYRLSCAQWGLGPHYLDYAHRDAERGLFENALRLFNRAKVLTPDLPFEPRAEATRVAIDGVLDRGRTLARRGETDAALAEFARVRQIDSASTFDPAREMERVKQAAALVPQAKKLALAGKLEPAVAKYREALEFDPGLGIDPVVDANKVYAPVVKEQGMALAREGRMEEAIAQLERAAVLDPKMFWEEPELTARNARARALREEADKIADQGDLQGAIAGYRAALAVDNGLNLDPEAEAAKRVAERWMEEANDRLSHAYQTEKYQELLGALDRFKQARKLDPKARVNAMRANELCWAAVKHNYAKQALEVCDAAVQSDADSWMARDSRGVARVLVGDTNGAIGDFEFYVQKSDRTDSVEQRKRWIANLKSGWRPQSFADLNAKQ